VKHLLVTNDFPPKIGGIQSYLWELWRRLPAEDVTVLTTAYEGSAEFDDEQPYRVVRIPHKWLLPTNSLVRQINDLAQEVDAELIVLDPCLPLGLIAHRLERPYVLIGHGAEFTIPASIPLLSRVVRRVVVNASGLIGGGDWVSTRMRSLARSNQPLVTVPPGVDTARFSPSSKGRLEGRLRY
jgi:phosphatidyl-myo-inositol dimannoside synthase